MFDVHFIAPPQPLPGERGFFWGGNIERPMLNVELFYDGRLGDSINRHSSTQKPHPNPSPGRGAFFCLGER